MARLKDLVEKIRSKNAGPFWVTIDVFCFNDGSIAEVSDRLQTDLVADLFKTAFTDIRRFEQPEIDVIKFSFPRPNVQGTRQDRDMHGAAYGVILEEMGV